jgi:hypothetical protein
MNILLSLILAFSIQTFEADFSKGDLKSIENYLPDKGKVYIELSIPFNVYGFFSKSQVLALFREIFRYYETKEFKVKERMEGGDSIILKIEWKIRDRIMDETNQTSIFIRLSLEGHKWFISEIKGA